MLFIRRVPITHFFKKKKDFKTKLPYIFAFGIEDKYQGVDCFEQINLFLNQLKNKD